MKSIVIKTIKLKKALLIPASIKRFVNGISNSLAILKLLSSITVVKDDRGNLGVVLPSKLYITGVNGELHLISNGHFAISTPNGKLLFNSINGEETVKDTVRRIEQQEATEEKGAIYHYAQQPDKGKQIERNK